MARAGERAGVGSSDGKTVRPLILSPGSFSFWDYWLTEIEVVKVGIVSGRLALAIWAPIFAAIALGFGVGGAVGGIIAALIGLTITRRIASSRRRRLAHLSPEEMAKRGMVSERIPWVHVRSIELKGSKVTISCNGKKLRGGVAKERLPAFLDFAKARVGDRVRVEA